MHKKLKIESNISNLGIVENAIDEIVTEIGINEDNYGKILVSTMEAVNNAIMHGNKFNMEKYVDVDIFYRNKELKIKVKDEGDGFDPGEVPDPTTPENLESVNGRGLFLISRLADEIKYSKRGNEITIMFKNPRG